MQIACEKNMIVMLVHHEPHIFFLSISTNKKIFIYHVQRDSCNLHTWTNFLNYASDEKLFNTKVVWF